MPEPLTTGTKVRELAMATLMFLGMAAILIWSWVFTIQQAEQWHDRQHAEGQDDQIR